MNGVGWATAICVASGPSLSDEQCALAWQAQREGRCRIVVVSDNWRRLPEADMLYSGDGHWWDARPGTKKKGSLRKHEYPQIAGYPRDHMRGETNIDAVRACFKGERWTCDLEASRRLDLHYIPMLRGNHLLPAGDERVTCGENSGFMAIQLARLRGAARILLIGYDMQRTGGLDHWFGAHVDGLPFADPKNFVKHFNMLAPQLVADGRQVINCTIESALTCFPRMPLADALAQ